MKKYFKVKSLEIDPFENLKKISWPKKEIAFGASIPIFFLVFGYALDHVDLIRYRPWIAAPIYFSLDILCPVSCLMYPVYVLRKRGIGPLFYPVPIPQIFKEFLISFPVLFLMCFGIGLVVGVLEIISKTELTQPEVLKWLAYAPSSILLFISIFFAFTLIPLCEEIFFRGFLYNALKTRVPVLFATLFQAIFFAALHPYDLLNRFVMLLMGIALVIAYEKRKNLLSPVIVHGLMNAVFCIPILVLTLHNFHFAAGTWEEAKVNPNWLESFPLEEIERQPDGMQQWQYAIDKWGSKGSRRWKKEANAFNAVCFWFPGDRTACAKAKRGIVSIYRHTLRDYRRAIIEADSLLSQLAEQREQCADALSDMGWSYYMLRDFQNSRIAFNKVVTEYKEYEKAVESSQKGIKWLGALRN